MHKCSFCGNVENHYNYGHSGDVEVIQEAPTYTSLGVRKSIKEKLVCIFYVCITCGRTNRVIIDREFLKEEEIE